MPSKFPGSILSRFLADCMLCCLQQEHLSALRFASLHCYQQSSSFIIDVGDFGCFAILLLLIKLCSTQIEWLDISNVDSDASIISNDDEHIDVLNNDEESKSTTSMKVLDENRVECCPLKLLTSWSSSFSQSLMSQIIFVMLLMLLSRDCLLLVFPHFVTVVEILRMLLLLFSLLNDARLELLV